MSEPRYGADSPEKRRQPVVLAEPKLKSAATSCERFPKVTSQRGGERRRERRSCQTRLPGRLTVNLLLLFKADFFGRRQRTVLKNIPGLQYQSFSTVYLS
ncbi:hypothetical protein XENOCAPTIV_006352 [Xenoophorus captivus]|uniref:Uncharacterized protein n=1 Tax=Xenoophorus captivus TaxID=1517983 RepID=A0ABV0QQB6_9TELE